MSEFFKPPPPRSSDLEPAPQQEWMGPPRAVMPGVVPVERVVVQNSDVAVYLSGFWVYPAGFEVQVRVLLKDEESVLGSPSFLFDEEAEQKGEIPPGKLRIGFEFADGSKVTNTGEDFSEEWFSGPWPTTPKMCATPGRGGEHWRRFLTEGLWVWPLPPQGKLMFVCEWPAAEIPLTRVEFDTVPILEASQRAQVVLA